MGMTVGTEAEEGAMMAEINTTPLVDVMLVLLIIFLITVPVVIQVVPVELPKVANIPTTTKPENVPLSINRNCEIFWGLTRLDGVEQLRERGAAYLLAEVEAQKARGAKIELPEAHIRADKDTEFRCVGGAIFALQRAGYQKIGFISEPPLGAVTR
ncbi:MAG: biopolymer transporter ExbD [Sphingomonadaceae bacterium]|uniref:ExbD/TolR family protein n=1 Tax=Thermaurantiacus sp. TaxID=2820283 RepID=UPI00298F0250|nr:biopolymer transporter ExbD [Thermaurantiacus sp.]MCS6986793.1 biopolymer transporter ExbD [Sphingomonadaceae bacterium]MDW8413944.1 biopolymer transporter ExbD [Thermaurantiacus sp.]